MENRRRPYFQHIAFSDEEDTLLRRAAKRQRVTYQTLIHGATMEAIRKVLGDEAELKRLAESNGRGNRPKVRGLGIREKLQAEERDDTAPQYEAPAAPSVTVNVSTPSANSGNDIATLARSIVEAPSYQRRRLVEAAVARISKDARNIDEARRTTVQLDEEIARLESKGTALDRLRARRTQRGDTK